jgi:tetratricopeptide (TPR) repeat protein
MTPEQAANHPSKNVISRALGAEESVEVDMKTIEIEDGTAFLLCSDGITRHITDGELRQLLTRYQDPNQSCEEMKRLCYERGAEDNLTAVIVQVGAPQFDMIDDEATVSANRPELSRTEPLAAAPSPPAISPLTPPSRIAFPATATPAERAPVASAKSAAASGGRIMLRIFIFVLFIAIAAGAFYGGMRFQIFRSTSTGAVSSVESAAAKEEADRAGAFELKRNALDSDPQKWISENVPLEMAREGIAKAADSRDPEFLYLYGRALMLTGNHREAMQAFDQAINNLPPASKKQLPLDVQIRLGSAAAAMKAKPKAPTQEALLAEQKAMRTLDDLLSIKSEAH